MGHVGERAAVVPDEAVDATQFAHSAGPSRRQAVRLAEWLRALMVVPRQVPSQNSPTPLRESRKTPSLGTTRWRLELGPPAGGVRSSTSRRAKRVKALWLPVAVELAEGPDQVRELPHSRPSRRSRTTLVGRVQLWRQVPRVSKEWNQGGSRVVVRDPRPGREE